MIDRDEDLSPTSEQLESKQAEKDSPRARPLRRANLRPNPIQVRERDKEKNNKINP
jgi:hypothetical protein